MGENRGQFSCPCLELAVMAATHRPKQVLVLHHHAHHFSCTLHQLLLTLGELGRSSSGQEEVGGHHCGNIPQGHLVVLLLGCHLPEEFQERLGKGTEPASNSSTALGFPPSTMLAFFPGQKGVVHNCPLSMTCAPGPAANCSLRFANSLMVRQQRDHTGSFTVGPVLQRKNLA